MFLTHFTLISYIYQHYKWLHIKWLVSIWNATLGWNGLTHFTLMFRFYPSTPTGLSTFSEGIGVKQHKMRLKSLFSRKNVDCSGKPYWWGVLIVAVFNWHFRQLIALLISKAAYYGYQDISLELENKFLKWMISET